MAVKNSSRRDFMKLASVEGLTTAVGLSTASAKKKRHIKNC